MDKGEMGFQNRIGHSGFNRFGSILKLVSHKRETEQRIGSRNDLQSGGSVAVVNRVCDAHLSHAFYIQRVSTALPSGPYPQAVLSHHGKQGLLWPAQQRD